MVAGIPAKIIKRFDRRHGRGSAHDSAPAEVLNLHPAYNRARLLPPLLTSIFAQDYSNFNVVICEDKSRERSAIVPPPRIRRSLSQYSLLLRNENNLGYDANIRTC